MTDNSHTLVQILKDQLHTRSNPDIKKWWENYVKESAPFLGVKMPTIRKLVHDWYRTNLNDQVDHNPQFELACSLLEGRYTEEKLAGMICFQEILLQDGFITCGRNIDKFAELFDNGHIYDWNVCDWFCIKVLGTLIQQQGESCARQIALWRDAQNLWRARASIVAFVPVASKQKYYPLIHQSIITLVRRPERFAKTAVGWILRDISKVNETFVKKAIEKQISYFSLESLRNATKYFPKDEKQYFRNLLKEESKS